MNSDAAQLLYAITDGPPPLTELPAGVGGAPLAVVSAPPAGEDATPLFALVSAPPIGERLTRPPVEDLLAFEKAVAALHQVGDVLPVRFGSVLASVEEVAAHLGERRLFYRQALARIAGCVELGVRLELPAELAAASPPPATPEAGRPPSGTEYLRARREHHARLQRAEESARRVGDDICRTFADLCRESQPLGPGGAAGTVVSVAFLVGRDGVDAFRRRFVAYRRETTGGKPPILLGPWPPYSFAAPPDASAA